MIRRGVEESLRASDTDYIELYQAHWPDPKARFEQTGAVLLELLEAEKSRHLGVSNFTPAEMEDFSRHPAP
ncbi:MAG: aldo/keto reductase [Acidimicrobiales bacterium]|jgi:aryl-alcohol dehydrogenase-like predicted oxidoreductase